VQDPSEEIVKEISKSGKHRYRYATCFLQAVSRLKEGGCLPGQFVAGSTRLPILAIHVPVTDLEHFGIGPEPFELEQNWRYLTSLDSDELIQVNLYMQQERILVCNLDPTHKAVRRFIREVDRLKHLGFLFYSKVTGLFISVYGGLDSEEENWMRRNRPKIEKVCRNNAARLAQASLVQHALQRKDARFYVSVDVPENVAFADEDEPTTPLERVREFV